MVTSANEDAANADADVRLIESAGPPTRFARGWHCLGLDKDFRDGRPHQVNAFGGKLVIWEDTKGQLNVLDSYCRHMGGDLSQGTVKGDEIACPFHDWRWGGDGKCKEIPYAKRVPLRARTQTWPTLVRNGMLFVWNDPEGGKPAADEQIPTVDGYGSDEWSEWLWYETVVDTNCREIIDNVVDMAHFFYIHGAFPTYFKNVFEKHTATQIMRGDFRDDKRSTRPNPKAPKLLGNSSDATYYGPSFMVTELTYHYEGFDLPCVLINSHYPVTSDSFILHYAISVKKVDELGAVAANKLATKMAEYIKVGFEEDVAIWRNKTRIDNPLLCEEDGAVYQLRNWYEQFYVNRDDVSEDMNSRFEHELDLTQATQSWQAEIDRIIAERSTLGEGAR